MSRRPMAAEQKLYKGGIFLSRLRRLRHLRGHGVHSPYIYSLYRDVFMGCKDKASENQELLAAIIQQGASRRTATEISRVAEHCALKSYAIDKIESCDIILCTTHCPEESIAEICAYARLNKVAVIITSPYKRQALCKKLLSDHRGTSIDRFHYMILLNNNLPKQHFEI